MTNGRLCGCGPLAASTSRRPTARRSAVSATRSRGEKSDALLASAPKLNTKRTRYHGGSRGSQRASAARPGRRRRRNMKPTLRDASVSAAYLLKAEDGLASARTSEAGATHRKEARGQPSSQTATTMVEDVFDSLPVELRLLALGLPDEMRRMAA